MYWLTEHTKAGLGLGFKGHDGGLKKKKKDYKAETSTQIAATIKSLDIELGGISQSGGWAANRTCSETKQILDKVQ